MNQSRNRPGASAPGLAGLGLYLLLLLPGVAAAQQVSTIAHGQGAPEALTHEPDGRALVAAQGRIYRLFEFNAEPLVVAGTGVRGFAGDGGPATQAQIGEVGAIVSMWDGAIVFADTSNHRIRRIDADGTISTIAGNGSASPSGDGGPATTAGLPSPQGLAPSADGGLYVSSGNRIRFISSGGVIGAFAGDEVAGHVNGDSASARFDRPGALAAVNDGGPGLLVADRGNLRIRMIALQTGQVSDIAGNGSDGYAGESGRALDLPLGEVSGMTGVASIYATIAGSHRIVRISPYYGDIAPFAGTGTAGSTGDGGPAAQARFSSPAALASLDSSVNPGTVLVADVGNARVRRIAFMDRQPATPVPPTAQAGNAQARLVFESWPEPLQIRPEAYEVRATPGGRVESVPDLQAFQFEGLENGQAYTFALRAIYPGGPSAWSAESNSVTPFAPQIPTVADASIAEGDAGETALDFTISVPEPAPEDLLVYYVTTETGTADLSDFTAEGVYQVTIPAGQTSATYTVRILGDTTPEIDETFTVELRDGAGQVFASATGTILNDDGATDTTFYGVPDRFTLIENAAESSLDVLANDRRRNGDLAGGRLELLAAPANGSAWVDDRGSPADASDDVLQYRPDGDWSGVDTLVYRACDAANACYQETAAVRVTLDDPLSIITRGQSGRSFGEAGSPRAMSDIRYMATPLATPRAELFNVEADPRPSTPWEAGLSGTVTRLYTLPAPADAQASSWRIHARFGWNGGQRVFGYVGVDANGDGQPSADEVRCAATMRSDEEFCDFPLAHPGTGPVVYWVMVHNAQAWPADVDVHVAAVPMIASDGSVVATGPARVDAGDALAYIVSYNDPSIIEGELAVGYVRVFDGQQEVDSLPVTVEVDADPSTNSGSALSSGSPYAMRLLPGQAHDRLFVDVPAGASELRVTIASAEDVDLYVAKASPSADIAAIGSAPSRASADASAVGPGGNETLSVSGAALSPGRWYVTPVNSDEDLASVTITATVTSAATPVVRPGSYFNAGRSGHGIFLYPAGNQWAGIWYTYGYGGRPTWYYAQGPRPGADGIWRAPVYHSAWIGNGNRLTRIGQVMVTPTGPDQFTFTHEVHGLTGSEPMSALGRGCPTYSGLPVDASSHWFDPATAGAGFSVQLWPQYEFYAAFVYDKQGSARFLSAESTFAGQAEATLSLEQLRGTPPTSFWQGTPMRFPVGTLRRTFAGGTLAGIDVSATFTDGVTGTWSASSTLQPLGGEGTTQGCAP
ncbi:Ig-like domain-containing protein [Arenimonas sp.]|uniref:Ig-like domain-containing protein n=1 Tax=Arenimonas sp. TaxID=1872635 RepID=UPI0035B44106